MDTFFTLLKAYGLYIALPVVVAGVLQGLKICFSSFFASNWGTRLIHFFPIVLGAALGLFLPLPTIHERVLYGAMLGQLSTLIYKVLTQTIAPTATLDAQRASQVPANPSVDQQVDETPPNIK